MRNFILTLMISLAGISSFGQAYNEQVQGIINDVSLDSLIQQLRNISGEDSVVVSGELTCIEHRVSSWGNDLAAEYIFETLEGYGLDPWFQDYSSGGRNVLAVQEGTQFPEEYYIICAHYDAVNYYCADDNGSGTVGVLEAARLFSAMSFEYSIIYALWDQEEIGLVGSNYYAGQAAANDQVIHGVINMDMISWDGDGDMVVEIHSSSLGNSGQLANYVTEIDMLYELETVPTIKNPGTTASDHAPFWNNGYAAVLLIEEYFGGDFNPYYHSANDRIAILDMPYFHEMVKLALGSIASMAMPVIETAAPGLAAGDALKLGNHPNPFSSETVVTYSLEQEGHVRLSLVSSQGLEVITLTEGYNRPGEHRIPFAAGDLPGGLYFIRLQTATTSAIHKIVIR